MRVIWQLFQILEIATDSLRPENLPKKVGLCPSAVHNNCAWLRNKWLLVTILVACNSLQLTPGQIPWSELRVLDHPAATVRGLADQLGTTAWSCSALRPETTRMEQHEAPGLKPES